MARPVVRAPWTNTKRARAFKQPGHAVATSPSWRSPRSGPSRCAATPCRRAGTKQSDRLLDYSYTCTAQPAARPLARRESRPDGSGTWPEQGFFAKIRVKSTEQAKSPNMLNTVICGGVELPSIQNDRDVPGCKRNPRVSLSFRLISNCC